MGAKTENAKAEGQDPVEAELKSMKTRLIVSLAFLAPLMYVSMGHMMGLPAPHFLHGRAGAIPFALTQLLLVLPILYMDRKFFTVGFKSLAKRSPNMDSLIALGSGAAVVYSILRFTAWAGDSASAIWSWWTATGWTCILNRPVPF